MGTEEQWDNLGKKDDHTPEGSISWTKIENLVLFRNVNF
jgi:hypothetical protein